MVKRSISHQGIPISISLAPALEAEQINPPVTADKKRLLFISLLAVCIASGVSLLAKVLIHLIDFVTNLAFYGRLSIAVSDPSHNTLGWFVILIPAAGGIIVGLMAFYGSKAIRGHGIPEAMEQILTNQSKIKPAITYLKPISAAIAIGTGGPFGAEGPIIATGGALGSTIGQLLKITPNERKILLAAGATAGMSAIFGSPIAAIFLAIELLLFEFSVRAIIPVALACITGAAGHHFLFEQAPVFRIKEFIQVPANTALLMYSIMGVLLGALSVLITKMVYYIEDLFEKLPLHWIWWPALGGLVVGFIGYFIPRTLGVGYQNITDVLSGTLPLQAVLALCVFKLVSWSVALGSGTSGGTLAPLLTIGGAVGALLGFLFISYMPNAGITVTLCALVGMSAMFAGASRALLTSIIFALETTAQPNALLPLLAACTASYFVSFLLMENTIMTEKIARRGVKSPDLYEPDILRKTTVRQVIKDDGLVLNNSNEIATIREWLSKEKEYNSNYFIIVDADNAFKGIVSSSTIFSNLYHPQKPVGELIKRKNICVSANDSLKFAIDIMVKENVDVLPVTTDDRKLIGILEYKDILSAYKLNIDDHHRNDPNISLKKPTLNILIHGRRIIAAIRKS